MFPVQYNPRTGEVSYNSDFDVELTYNDGEAVNPVIDPDRPRPSWYADQLLQSLVLNPPAAPKRYE